MRWLSHTGAGLALLTVLSLPPQTALALDHDNLDPNRPIGMEDAYAIPKGEIGLEGGVRFNDRREGRTRVTFQPQIIYGAFDNMQIEMQGDLMTEPNTLVGSAKSGDLHVGALYNFNTETIGMPAFAARVAAEVSGEDASHPDANREMGSEDFSYMLEARPGAYLFLGTMSMNDAMRSLKLFVGEVMPAVERM